MVGTAIPESAEPSLQSGTSPEQMQKFTFNPGLLPAAAKAALGEPGRAIPAELLGLWLWI